MSVVFRKGNVSIKKIKDNKYKIDYEEGEYKHFWKFVKELVGEKNSFEAHSVVKRKEKHVIISSFKFIFQASRRSICEFRKRWVWKGIYKFRGYSGDS